MQASISVMAMLYVVSIIFKRITYSDFLKNLFESFDTVGDEDVGAVFKHNI